MSVQSHFSLSLRNKTVYNEILVSVLDFQKKILGPAGPQVFIFGRQNKYSSLQKLNLRLTEKEWFRLSLELSFERFLLEARLTAGARENEPALKRKSPPTGIQF